MQHPDEGTIHAWLDGALSPDEAARVEAHARECPECAAAIAEARGFIAASSRILTALDNAPRGVIPVAAPKKRFDPFIWRIAATVLVVAGGTLVVMRSRGGGERVEASNADTALVTATAAAPTSRASAPTSGKLPAKPSGIVVQRNRKAVALEKAGVGGARPSSMPAAQSRVADAAAMDHAAEPQPLRVIAMPRIGANVTVYEIGSDTVTLTESKPLALVAAGAGGARQEAAKAVAEPRRMAPTAAVAPRAQTQSASEQPVAAALSARAAGSPEPANAITWSDPATGSIFTLTGKVSPAQLEQLKIRIERERAAAAAAAKNTP
jgi:hypothetical protein